MKRCIYETFLKSPTIVLMFILGISTAGFTQIALVEDINPYVHFDNEYGSMTEVDGTLFFAADQVLWKTNGTTPGSAKLKAFVWIGPMIRLNGMLVFSADDGKTGRELWKSDGTEKGTVLLKDIWTGNEGSDPNNFTLVNNVLYFVASTTRAGAEVWRTDGTKGGTNLLADVMAGPESSNPRELVNYAGILVFVANDGIKGDELRVVAPGRKSSTEVIDILPGSAGSNPSYLTVVNSFLYFNAYTPEFGTELWKSDGTSGGTSMVRDIWPGPESGYPGLLVDVVGTLYFIADDGSGSEYWKSNGTDTGTSMAMELTPGPSSTFGDYPYQEEYGYSIFDAVAANGKIYFGYANHLYESDGTTAGTHSLGVINNGYYYYSPRLYLAKGTIYVLAMDESNGSNYGHAWRLLRVENSALVTVTPLPRSENINLQLIDTSIGIFFPFADAQRNFRLWISDGTAEGTYPFHDSRSYTLSSTPRGMSVVDDHIIFYADDHYEHVITNLWRSDGTLEGTYRISDRPVDPPDLGTYHGLTPAEISSWISRISGTRRLHADSSNIHLLEYYKEAMYFSVTDPVKSYAELWKTDGTERGTVMIKVLSREYGGGARDGAVLNDILYFAGTPYNIWRTDGTAKGTFEVGYTGGGNGVVDTDEYIATSTTLFFRAYYPGVGIELFKLDAEDAPTSESSTKASSAAVAMEEGEIQVLSYPNPFENTLTFTVLASLTQPMPMSLRTPEGKTILRIDDLTTNQHYTIGQELRSGFYLMYVKVGDRVYVQRVMKVN